MVSDDLDYDLAPKHGRTCLDEESVLSSLGGFQAGLMMYKGKTKALGDGEFYRELLPWRRPHSGRFPRVLPLRVGHLCWKAGSAPSREGPSGWIPSSSNAGWPQTWQWTTGGLSQGLGM